MAALRDHVADILNPKAPAYTRDHKRDNLAYLRSLEATAVAARLQREEEAARPARPSAPAQYATVTSKLAAAGLGRKVHSPGKAAPAAACSPGDDGDGAGAYSSSSLSGSPANAKENARPGSVAGSGSSPKDFLRAKSRCVAPPAAEKPFVRAAAAERKAAVPTRAELIASGAARPVSARSSPSKDHVSGNIVAATSAAPPRRAAADPAAPLPKKADYGSVPAYLQQRKEKWAAEEAAARKAREDAEGCPPGHRLLPEAERLETLALVQKSLGETQDALKAMPLRVELPSKIRLKAELEAKVEKLEAAVKLFSRPKVFVKLDE